MLPEETLELRLAASIGGQLGRGFALFTEGVYSGLWSGRRSHCGNRLECRCTIVSGKEKPVEQREVETERAELRVTSEEARNIANLLRYAISLNTTAGLVSPAARRLATPTYRSVELAALVLEGKTFEEAAQEAEAAWSGSLEEDHRRALEFMQTHREALQDAMIGLMGPEQFSKYLEISQKQFLELVKAQIPQAPESAEG